MAWDGAWDPCIGAWDPCLGSVHRRLKCSEFLRECPSAVARLLGHLSNLPGTLQPRALCSWNLSRRWPGLARQAPSAPGINSL